MTPFEQAATWYQATGNPVPLGEICEAHCLHGGMIALPHLFILGRPVRHDWPDERLCDFWDVAAAGEADCWHVYLAAGAWPTALPFLPYELPWISWHRRDKLRVWRWENFRAAKWHRD